MDRPLTLLLPACQLAQDRPVPERGLMQAMPYFMPH